MLSIHRQLTYWLIGISSAVTYFVLSQLPWAWTWFIHDVLEYTTATSFSTVVYKVYQGGPDILRQLGLYYRYQLGIASAAVGISGRIAEWLYTNYAVDVAEEGSRERAWEIGITHTLLAYSLVYYLEFLRKPKLSDFFWLPSTQDKYHTPHGHRPVALCALRNMVLGAFAMTILLSLRYFVSQIPHPHSHESYPGDLEELTRARFFFNVDRIFFEVDQEKHINVWYAMMYMLKWSLRLMGGGIAQTVDKATFEVGDYGENRGELDERIE